MGGIEVVGADSMAAALQEVQLRAPAMIICDIDLPDRSGLELLGELGVRGLKPHVIFVSAYVKAYRAQIPPHAGVEVLEKPVTLEHLRSLVASRLAHPIGEASPFGVSDYLQLASLGRHSVVIEVTSDSYTGHLVVLDGEAWTAQDTAGTGLAAFHRMALGPSGAVRCQTLTGDPGTRTLTGSAEALLLESARRADEARGAFTELSLEQEPGFEEWFDQGVEASLVKRHAEALAAFRRAARLRPDDPKTLANINRLEQLLKT